MNGKRSVFWGRFLLLALYFLLVAACSETDSSAADLQQEVATTTAASAPNVAEQPDGTAAETGGVVRPDGWQEASHSNDADPNYEVVFPQDTVEQMTITIAPEDWEAMQANMVTLFGENGTGVGPGGRGAFGDFVPRGDGAPPEDFEPPAGREFPEGLEPPQGDRLGRPGGPGFGGGDFTSENPMWVAGTVEFAGQTWTNVGVRYKGNSSLRSGWSSGGLKLPFKLDFDEFEDDYPEIDDQRFYGFKQLSLANGFGDPTYMRDKITYDLLEEAGLPAAETAYYELILDYGEGPVNLGLYVAIEVIDDTVIDRYFGDDDGNIYEGDGRAASLAEGTFEQIEESFQKENNEDEADYGDIETLYQILHDEKRTTDREAWRADLESVFDVPAFLEWLAISSVIQHWDSYGSMSHNYYLYHEPDSGRLTWISWDHNLVLGAMGRGGIGDGRSGGSLDKADVGDNWPLIRFLLDDPIYYETYVGYVEETVALFNPDEMAARYQELANLLRPYVAEADGADAFEAAVEQLTTLTYERYEAAANFLANR